MDKFTQLKNQQSNFSNPLYQKHSKNTSLMTEAHTAYLQVRQESLQQINSMQINLANYQRFVKQ
ncbi:hypothetical protein ACSQ6I_25180 [Anabaena sp. WFMT]|uniref:hypothetical protein n=1 Tax=Anabaena sp. WFMT TaxID=3449730 RepID=UPI003F1ED86A